MSMHIVGPALTTTRYAKRKQVVTKAQQAEFERGWRGRNQRLKEIGLPKESFEQYLEWVYGKGKKAKGQKNPGKKVTKAFTRSIIETKQPIVAAGNQATDSCQAEEALNSMANEISECPENDIRGHGKIWSTGAPKTKQKTSYTGSKIIGIAVLHKSCLQPVFSQEEAIDIARMRR